jgi:phage gpG-like protein
MKDFNSPKAFAAHLMRLAAVGAEVVPHLAAHAANVVAQEAKDELGRYQEAALPFPAWKELASSTVAAHAKLGVGESPLLVTGQLYASIETTAHGNTAVAGSTSPIMVYQEFGTSRIPARSVMGMAFVHSRKTLLTEFHASIAAWIAGRGWRRPRIDHIGQTK